MHGLCTPRGAEDLVLTPVVEAGCVRSLWFGVQLPRQVALQGGAEGLTLEIRLRLHLQHEVQHGAHQGGAEGGAEGGVASHVVSQEESLLRLRVRGEEAQHAGDDRAWRLSRLRWLDSDLGEAGVGGEAGLGTGTIDMSLVDVGGRGNQEAPPSSPQAAGKSLADLALGDVQSGTINMSA